MINGKKVLAIVTARANSQGLPGKNHKQLLGSPLFTWSIMSAIRSKYVDTVVISSNCEHVKEISLQLIDEIKNAVGQCKDLIKCKNVEFLQRPEEYATSISKNEDSLIHAYHYAKDHLSIDADIIANLQPTSPIRDTKDNILLDECLEKMENEKADSLFTGTRHTPFYFKIIDGEVKAEWDIYNRPMRQELENSNWAWHWHDDGNVYVVSTPLLLSSKCRLGGKISLFETDEFQTIQIDISKDFQLIEAVCKICYGKGERTEASKKRKALQQITA